MKKISVFCATLILAGCKTAPNESATPSFLHTPTRPALYESVFSGSEKLSQKITARYSKAPSTAAYGTFGPVDFSGSRLRSLRQSYGYMIEDTEHRMVSDRRAVAVCGPSVAMNEMICHNQRTGEVLERAPIPGSLSATPLFHNGSWIVATTKGFVFKSNGLSDQGTPVLGMENMAFWGAESRSRMSYLRDFYRESLESPKDVQATDEKSESSTPLQYAQVGWGWYLWSSSEFVSHMAIQGSRVIGLTANQFVYAIDFETGKIVWASRIGKDEDLRILSRSLSVSSRNVIVGTTDGALKFLESSTGKVLWEIKLESKFDERFQGVVAKPLVIGQRIVASSATGETQLINEVNRKTEWKVPYGSVASARKLGEFIYLGSAKGELLKIDLRNGKVVSKISMPQSEQIVSLYPIEKSNLIVVALANGKVQVHAAADLDLVQDFLSQGTLEGEFFGVEESGSACISTSNHLLRCFSELASR